MTHPPATSPENPVSAPEKQRSPANERSVDNVPVSAPAVIETSRLRLRPWRDTDAPGPGEGPDAASLRFMPPGAQPGPQDFPAWLARRRREMATGADLHWCVADLATDALTETETETETDTATDPDAARSMLGNVQIFRMGPVQDRFQGELGYWLRPGARGHGIIGEALTPLIALAFTPVVNGGLGLTRLYASTDSENHTSQSILRSAGFTRWGADHQAFRRGDGSLSDGMHFELLAGLGGHAMALEALEPITLDGGPSQAEGAPRVRLRRWLHTDAERIVQACSDERTRHWLVNLPMPYTLQDAHSFIAGCRESAQEGKSLCWCVADPDSNLCIGSVAVMDLGAGRGTAGEIGYWTHPEARGGGVMSEAVRLAVRHAFIPREDGGLGRQRLRLNAAVGNSASQHIAAANAFVEVGRDRRAEPLGDGTFVDLVRFDQLVEEWNSQGGELRLPNHHP